MAHAQVVASRKRRAAAISLAVPATVRVEAGWDRTSPAWAFPNKLRIADAHLGALLQTTPASQITVVTSDPADMRLVAGDTKITITAI